MPLKGLTVEIEVKFIPYCTHYSTLWIDWMGPSVYRISSSHIVARLYSLELISTKSARPMCVHPHTRTHTHTHWDETHYCIYCPLKEYVKCYCVHLCWVQVTNSCRETNQAFQENMGDRMKVDRFRTELELNKTVKWGRINCRKLDIIKRMKRATADSQPAWTGCMLQHPLQSR